MLPPFTNSMSQAGCRCGVAVAFARTIIADHHVCRCGWGVPVAVNFRTVPEAAPAGGADPADASPPVQLPPVSESIPPSPVASLPEAPVEPALMGSAPDAPPTVPCPGGSPAEELSAAPAPSSGLDRKSAAPAPPSQAGETPGYLQHLWSPGAKAPWGC